MMSSAEVVPYTTRDVETIKAVIAPGVSNEELALFVKVSEYLGLSVFRDEIVLIGRWDKRAGRDVYRHQITVHGRRVLAARTGELRGIDGPYWTGPRDEAGEHRWLDVWDSEEPPHAARVFVYRAGWAKPANGTVPWREFAQVNRDGKLTGLWPDKPAHMLGKVAEALALRRAFPEVLTAHVVGEYDEADSEHGSPAHEVTPSEEVGTSPSPPRESLTERMLTEEQTREIQALVAELGFAGRERRGPMLTYLSEILGRTVDSTKSLTWHEGEILLEVFRGDVEALREAEPIDTEAEEEPPL